ncbi:MAG: biotin/lipoyl-binding protein [Gammaproteobacteria bacterium]|jgi:multidrug efflux pump subunit AcrA (membrane-fusion protein)|nr:biotin/lipoyl-binding protein [Gammaproteobacteria bacterium]
MTARSTVRLLLPMLVLLLSAGVYYSLVSSKTQRDRPVLTEKVWQIDVMTARRQALSPNLTLYGRIESPELLKSAAPGGGIIERVFVRNGAAVSRGDPLVTMDRRDFSAALLQAEADLRDIDSQIAELEIRHRSNQSALQTERELASLADAEVERLVQLKKQNLSADTALNAARSELGRRQLEVTARQFEVDSYPTQLRILQARHDRNQAMVAETRLAMERSDLRAPFDAIVSEVAVAAGDRVSLGQILVSLFPLDALEIRAHLPTSYIPSVQRSIAAGQVLSADIANRAELGRFPLLRLAGEAEATGIDAYFSLHGAVTQFRPGELLALNLELPAESNVFAVPYQAIYGNSRIYKVVGDRLVAVDVETIGQSRTEGQPAQVLIRSQQIDDGELIAATHLPNAISGLKVKHSEQ